MDAKMDSGLLEPGDTLEDDYDVRREISAEEVVGVMDALLCLEVFPLIYEQVRFTKNI